MIPVHSRKPQPSLGQQQLDAMRSLRRDEDETSNRKAFVLLGSILAVIAYLRSFIDPGEAFANAARPKPRPEPEDKGGDAVIPAEVREAFLADEPTGSLPGDGAGQGAGEAGQEASAMTQRTIPGSDNQSFLIGVDDPPVFDFSDLPPPPDVTARRVRLDGFDEFALFDPGAGASASGSRPVSAPPPAARPSRGSDEEDGGVPGGDEIPVPPPANDNEPPAQDGAAGGGATKDPAAEPGQGDDDDAGGAGAAPGAQGPEAGEDDDPDAGLGAGDSGAGGAGGDPGAICGDGGHVPQDPDDARGCAGEMPHHAAPITGTDGHDLILGTPGDDDILGLAGADRIDAREGTNTVFAGAGDDHVLGGAGRDILAGGAGDDTLVAEAGRDTLIGGAGDDRLFGGAGDDLVRGGAGDDIIHDGPGRDTVLGDGGDDHVVVTADADPDVFHGGDGTDTLDLSSAEGLVHVDMDEGVIEWADGSVDLFTSFERFVGIPGGETRPGMAGRDEDGPAFHKVLGFGVGDRLKRDDDMMRLDDFSDPAGPAHRVEGSELAARIETMSGATPDRQPTRLAFEAQADKAVTDRLFGDDPRGMNKIDIESRIARETGDDAFDTLTSHQEFAA